MNPHDARYLMKNEDSCRCFDRHKMVLRGHKTPLFFRTAEPNYQKIVGLESDTSLRTWLREKSKVFIKYVHHYSNSDIALHVTYK